MGVPNRSEVEAILRSVTGGESPDVGDVLVYTEVGWKFFTNLASGAEAATILGSVVMRIEVFDAEGESLGFMPIYDSIT